MTYPAKKRVFLSFLAEDKDHADGVRLLSANPRYQHLEFYDESVRVPINSHDAVYVKRRIREKINRTSVTVCLISERTHTSPWVDWELEESIRKGNTIIAMAVKGTERATLPSAIRELELPFYRWDPERLGQLISEAP